MTAKEPFIKQMEIGPMKNFIYFVGDSATQEVAVIDPAWSVPTILEAAQDAGVKIVAALVSHFHFDHCNGLDELLDTFNIPIYVNENEMQYVEQGKGHLNPVKGGDSISIGVHEIKFIHTPGHTPGSHCFLVDGQHLFTGDTLFINGCGRCDLPGGDAEKMYDTLTEKLMTLEDQTLVYPGHNYATHPTSTIGQEKLNNPFMQTGSLEEFLHQRMGV